MTFSSRPHWVFFSIPAALFVFGCWASYTVYAMFVAGLVASDSGSTAKDSLAGAGALIIATNAVMVFAVPFVRSTVTRNVVYVLTFFLLSFEVGTMVITQYSINQSSLNKETAAIARVAELDEEIKRRAETATLYQSQGKLTKSEEVSREVERLSAEKAQIKASAVVSNNGILKDPNTVIAFYTVRALLISIIGLVMFHLTGSVTSLLTSEINRHDRLEAEAKLKKEEEDAKRLEERRRRWAEPVSTPPSPVVVAPTPPILSAPSVAPAAPPVKDIFEDLFSNPSAPLSSTPSQLRLPGVKRGPGRPEKLRAHYPYSEIKEGILRGDYVPSISKIEAVTGMKRIQIKEYLQNMCKEGILFQVNDRYYKR